MRDADFIARLKLADLERLCRLYADPNHVLFGTETHQRVRALRNQAHEEEAEQSKRQ